MSKLKKPRVSVIEESDTGRNKKFIDNKTGKTMTRAQFANEIDNEKYKDYHVRKVNNLRTPVSNPNTDEDDNLG